MKQHQEVPRPFALTIIAIIIVCLLIIIFSPQANGQSLRKMTGKEYNDKLQKQNSWENYRSTRLKKAKEYAKANKQQLAIARQEDRINRKIRRYYGQD